MCFLVHYIKAFTGKVLPFAEWNLFRNELVTQKFNLNYKL